MRLIASDKIRQCFEENLSVSRHLDVAVAWATDCDIITLLEQRHKAGMTLRSIVGTSRNFTYPRALFKLAKLGAIQLADDPKKGIFHKKIYIFYKKSKVTAWVGSPNLTASAFGQNAEAVLEIDDQAGEVAALFEKLWQKKPAANNECLQAYAADWKRPPVVPDEKAGSDKSESFNKRKSPASASNPLLEELARGDWSWREYEAAIKFLHRHWKLEVNIGVTGQSGWVATIKRCNTIIRDTDWATLDQEDISYMLGQPLHNDYSRGCLGRMSGRIALGFFHSNKKHAVNSRLKIRGILRDLQKYSGPNFPKRAEKAFRELTDIDGVAGAIASRFIALARPDRGVSVNDGSMRGLAFLANMAPTTLDTVGNYPALLEWVEQQPWFNNAPRAVGNDIAWARAALLDVFVYKPVQSSKRK
ncbi:phospholipase D family protein [Ferrovibrio sp.]|uniref:phospholipase D family protein n=1 Tax=Ferrovibrio sp. TaxID=1917215 RepID=UPI0025C3CE53|nr:phospholipase D family protein [Ferrovibrio sp.]